MAAQAFLSLQRVEATLHLQRRSCSIRRLLLSAAQGLGRTGFGGCSTWAHWLQLPGSETGSRVVARGLISSACGILPDQGSNSCVLHWQVGSLPLSHKGTLEVSTETSSSLQILSSAMSSVFTFIKGILPFCYSIFSFWFLRRSVSLLTVPICSCILSTLSISILSVVIILVLNPWSDNSRSLSFLILMFYLFKLYILNRYFQISLKCYWYFSFW